MLKRLTVQNFRSIERSSIEFAPITIFFGPTSAGKSTLFYSLLVLRNFILNPNQSVDGFFNLGFQNLGGFDACVFNHELSRPISIAAEFSDDTSYGLAMRKTDAIISFRNPITSAEMLVPIPYAINQSWSETVGIDREEYSVNWNGIAVSVAPKSPTAATNAPIAASVFNSAITQISKIDIAPHRRGFFKPSYQQVPLTPIPTSEDEVATLIINDQNVPARISLSTDEIFNRDFRTHTPPGTAITFFQTTERSGAKVPGYLVNDGFGVNQTVYMLAKIYRPDVQTLLIEEPEVHLHPSVIRKLARVFVQIATDEGRQLIFTTHSEQFLLSILACVKEKLLLPSQIRCYHATRKKKETVFSREEVSDNGQISGGLASFMEAELEDVRTFLAVGD